MKNIRLVALDLDDTTLRSDASLAPETREALIEAANAGIEIVVASGRAFTSLPKEVLALPGVHYAICSNGASVEMAKTGERICSRLLPGAAAREILDSFPDALFECFIAGQPYCERYYVEDPFTYGCSPAYVSYVQTTRIPVDGMRDFIAKNLDRLDSIDIVCPKSELKTAVYARAKEIPGVYVTSSSPRLVELAAADAGKGTALRWLCERLGVPAGATAAFGNGDNDADMIKFAGCGVAVANATPYCRKCADYICESNDELGVAKTLLRLLTK